MCMREKCASMRVSSIKELKEIFKVWQKATIWEYQSTESTKNQQPRPGLFRLFCVKLCKYANLRIYFNCTETHFLAIIFSSYTLYSPRAKNEPTAHGKQKRKAKRNIPRWNKPKICGTQKAVRRSKRKSQVAKGEQANRAKKEKVLNGHFQFKQFLAGGQWVVKKFFW